MDVDIIFTAYTNDYVPMTNNAVKTMMLEVVNNESILSDGG